MISGVSEVQEAVDENHLCSICLELYNRPISINNCRHIFCFNCLNKAAISKQDYRCPLCRAGFKKRDLETETELWQLLIKKYPLTVAKRERKATDLVTKLVIGNITQEVEDNNQLYKWTFFIDQAKDGLPLSELLEGVEIKLHPSFNPCIIKIPVTNNEEIALCRAGWGEFRIGVRLYWKPVFTDVFTEVFHDLQFVPVKKSTLEITLRKK